MRLVERGGGKSISLIRTSSYRTSLYTILVYVVVFPVTSLFFKFGLGFSEIEYMRWVPCSMAAVVI